MRAAVFALLLGTALTSANAAEIVNQGQTSGVNVLRLSGRIVSGDAAKFQQVASGVSSNTAVFLNSPGGTVIEGLRIGEYIRAHGFRTAVEPRATCASACALIWLAGVRRYVTPSSRVGFHAASNINTGQESGTGNALVGSYLTRLGLSYDAVAYATSAAPDDVRWLNPTDAEHVGITYTMLNDVEPSQPAQQVVTKPQPAITTPSFVAGRQARIEYEQWVSGLSDGAYKDGVLYWAAHRSDRPQPACTGSNAQWQAGCITSRARLANSDARRVTDNDFRSGWNSL